MYQSGHTKSDDLIESARHAREVRSLKRRQESAAIVVQSAVRGHMTRKKIKQEWYKELDELIGYQKKATSKQNSQNQTGAQCENKNLEQTPVKEVEYEKTEVALDQWKFASFGSNTLTGAYGNFAVPLQQTSNAKDKQNSGAKTQNQQPGVKNHTNSATGAFPKTLEKKVSLKVIPNTQLYRIIQKFLFVLHQHQDKDRFLFVCQYLLNNVDKETSTKIAYVALSVHKHLVNVWIKQLKKLLWICCKFIKNIQISKEPDQLSVHLRMLITFTDVNHWKVLKKRTALHPVLSQVCAGILCELQQHGCLSIIAQLLSKNGLALINTSSLQATLTIVSRLMSANKFSDESIIMFSMSVLSVPSLFWHMSTKASQCLQTFLETPTLEKVISLLHVENACSKYGILPQNAKPVHVTQALCMCANLIQILCAEKIILQNKHVDVVMLINQFLCFLNENSSRQKTSASMWHVVLGYFSGNLSEHSDSMHLVKKQIELLWNPLFVKAVFHDVLTLKSLHEEGTIPTQAARISSRQKDKAKFSDKFGSFLKRIASSRPEKVLLPTGGRKMDYVEVKNTCSACLLYRRSLSIFNKQLQLEMLTGLTFMDEVLCRLWRFICEIGSSGGLQLFLSSLMLPPDAAEPIFAVFTLFCDMTAHILSILDDVEFYDQQVPFHLEELVTVSNFLLQFVFKVIWSCIVTDLQSPMYPVFNSSYTLLMMLYDRDARRAFTPNGHWLCKDVKPSTIRGEVEKGVARAKLIMEKIPFIIPHKDRVILFNSFVAADKNLLGISPGNDASIHIRVRRSRLVEDGFDQLSNISSDALKGIIRVKFFNDLGLDEAGIDQDGVFKEFLEEIIKKVFNPDMNLFKVTGGGESKLYPSPLSHMQYNHLDLFSFVGRMLGKAVYEGIVLDIPFANFFLRNLLGQHQAKLYSPLDELPSLDVEFYNNLTWIKRYDGDIADLGLTFTFEEDVMGKVESHDLVPGGSAISVTNENRIMYIHTLAHYRMHTQIQQQTRAFVRGFRSVISPQWTSMFSAPELQRLISGDNVDMDLADLKKNVVYYGGFHSRHRVVLWLWDILERDYTPSQRSAFLKFVTSCSRPPLLGFQQLQPQFTIRCVEVPDDEDPGDTVANVLRGFLRLSATKGSNSKSQKYPHRLPTASTCFNLLKLPNYPSKDVLKEKLKQAIANNTGFELS
uniref:HECT-type E3 ubiquitin transferase n=1 Tax=Phallusia mammillata TaxID=59560 RepID=A0A6F9DWF1_9ASCI|nr:ubiquitin-protein ligase E3B [Phallusia mammillata]